MSGYPGFSINGRPYRGNLETNYMVEAICESVSYNSSACMEFPKYLVMNPAPASNNENHTMKTIALVLVVVIVFGILMIMLYKKM